MKLKLTNVRLSFPVLWTPEEYEKGDNKPRYGCALLIRKDDPQLKAVKSALSAAGKEKFGAKFTDKAFRKGIKFHAFRDGDSVTYDGYENCMFISANRSAKQGAPKVVDWDKSELRETDGRPYAGCYVNAIVEFYGDSRYGKTMNASLIAVQFRGHGDAFAGGSRYDEDDFDVEEEAGEELDEPATEAAEEDDYEAEEWDDEEDDDPLG